MIFVFHGDNQPKLREEFLEFKKNYGETRFWEGKLAQLPSSLATPSLFKKKELVVLEDPDLSQLDQLGKLGKLRPDLLLLFSRRLIPAELNQLKGAKVFTFWEEVPKNVFPFLDALLTRDRKKALLEAHRLLREGTDLDFLLKMIGWQMRNLARVREGEVLGMSPYVVGKLKKFASAWKSADLRRAFSLLLQEDLRQKKGKKIPFDFFIGKLTES